MKVKVIILLLFIIPAVLKAQDYIFFSDSPNGSYYFYSSGSYSGLSAVVLNNGRIPVDMDVKYSGLNALRVRWKSASGGSWSVSIGSAGMAAYDIRQKDSLLLRIFSYSDLDSLTLPLIYLEDINDKRTAPKKLSDFAGVINKNNWLRVSIPLKLLSASSDSADLSKIKAVAFTQNFADGALHTIYFDEIRMVTQKDTDFSSPETPKGLKAKAYSTYIDLTWQPNSETDLEGYRIYRKENEIYKIIGAAEKGDTILRTFAGVPPKTLSYRISAYDKRGNESSLSPEVTASTVSISDSALLEITQKAAFKYFWDYAHPVSGLARERLGSGETVTIGGSGFGVMAIITGAERGFITRSEASSRILKIVKFLSLNADRFHGAFSHWLNGSTGRVIPFSQKDDGGDIVETAYMIQGLLTARQYFNLNNSDEEQIRNIITSIWESVEWDWYRKDAAGNYLYWHWSPNYGWQMNMQLRGWNETLITYLLAIASPKHPVPASMYYSGWAGSSNYRNGKSFYGIPLDVGWDYGGPLFFSHYSFLGFDPRNKKDKYTNYFINNRHHALIHQAYSKANPRGFPGYDEDTWGLTASDDPVTGYMAHEPNNDNGTISPTAAISSMPYTPKESIAALKSFYYEYGDNLWGEYGPKDAFNVKLNWFANSYIAIDQGPIIVMIENYRSGLLWKYFMANPEIKPMLDAIGFVPDSASVGLREGNNDIPEKIILYGNFPNPFNPSTVIKFRMKESESIEIHIYDLLGRKVRTLLNDYLSAGSHEIKWDGLDEAGHKVSSGIYLYSVKTSDKIITGKMVFQK
ncbi:MAG: glucoamylase family protein [Bacillota bacterium]